MEKKSLWAEVKDIPAFRTPVVILKEQAELLDVTTNSILRGEVKSFRVDVRKDEITLPLPSPLNIKLKKQIVPDKNGSMLGFSLFIIAPQMNYYSYCVLTIAYDPVEVYPVYLESTVLEGFVYCKDESNFILILKQILSSEKIKTIIMSLIAQSQEMAS